MAEKNRRDTVITDKILMHIEDMFEFIADMDETTFLSDRKTQKAVTMSMIVIGELSKAYSSDFINTKFNVPWKKVQAFRNVAAHNYEAIKMEVVWDTVKISIPELKAELLSEVTPCQKQ